MNLKVFRVMNAGPPKKGDFCFLKERIEVCLESSAVECEGDMLRQEGENEDRIRFESMDGRRLTPTLGGEPFPLVWTGGPVGGHVSLSWALMWFSPHLHCAYIARTVGVIIYRAKVYCREGKKVLVDPAKEIVMVNLMSCGFISIAALKFITSTEFEERCF